MMRYPLRKVVPVLVVSAVAAVGMLDRDARSVAQAAPGPNEVLVVNPAANPARTTIVGPVAATIANTAAEAVPVAIQGTPNVGVTGAVSIAGTPTVAVSGPVTVATAEGQALAVHDAGAATVAFVVGGQLLIDPGETFESEQFAAVPLGYRLVIEAMSIDASLPDGQLATQATLLANSEENSATFRFVLAPAPALSPTTDRFVITEVTKVNVAEGNGVIVAVARNANTGTGLVNVALSGYLVPVN